MSSGQDQPAALPGFIVFVKDGTTDQEQLDRYRQVVGATFAGHDATVLAAYGAQEVLEGPAAEGVVLLRFPSTDAARAWYRSPAYQAAAQHRFRGATYRAILVEGRPPS